MVLGECCSLWLSRYFCWWEVWLIPNADTQCTVVERGEEAKKQRKCFMFKFSLTCLRIWIFISSLVWENIILKILNFPICEHDIFLHLLRCSVFSDVFCSFQRTGPDCLVLILGIQLTFVYSNPTSLLNFLNSSASYLQIIEDFPHKSVSAANQESYNSSIFIQMPFISFSWVIALG